MEPHDFGPEMNAAMERDGMETRKLVLFKTLQLEVLTQIALGEMLGLDPRRFKALGHTSKALGLEQRIQFLMDFDLIDEEKDKTKFLWFLQIRNQMMHNIKSTSFAECLTFTDAGLNARSLLKAFPQSPTFSLEKQLRWAYYALCKYLQRCAERMNAETKKRLQKDVS